MRYNKAFAPARADRRDASAAAHKETDSGTEPWWASVPCVIQGREGQEDVTAGQGSGTARTSVGFHRFVVFTAVTAFFLLTAGALVTSNNTGLSVPSWPFAPGTLLPQMAGGFVALLTMGVAIRGWRREQAVSVRTS